MTRVTVYSKFDDLSPAFRVLFYHCSQREGFFLSFPWFRHLTEAGMDRQIQLRIYGLDVDAEPNQATIHAALTLCHEKPLMSLLKVRVLRAVTNYYSGGFGPILDEEINHPNTQFPHPTQQMQLNLLADAISAELPRWDMIDLHPVVKNSPAFQLLTTAFNHAGMAVESYFCSGNWTLKVLQRNYQQYFDGLPSRLRHTLARKAAQLNRESRFRLEIITSESEAKDRIAIYLQIYENSWKEREPYPDFVPGWILESARHHWLRLGIAYIDDQAAAAQVWLVQEHKASIYKLAHDARFEHTSVGSLLTAHLMRHVIDTDRVQEVDFLNGDESYKQDWMSHRNEYWGVIAFNRKTIKGQLAYGLQRASRHFKQVFRSAPTTG